MIFSELYSVYYNAVAEIIKVINEAKPDGKLIWKDIEKVINKEAFKYSNIYIVEKIKSGDWPIITGDFTTTIENVPTMPLTTIQKRWLKSVSLDPRIKLFDFSFKGLEEVEPLFTPEDYKIYDRYADGDNFEDEEYKKNFRILLNAIENEHTIKIEYISGKNNRKLFIGLPNCLEYSEKDDKFRLLVSGVENGATINLARIINIEVINGEKDTCFNKPYDAILESLKIKIRDENNALERCLIHFAHFKKECVRIDDINYLLKIYYDENDRNEMIIRILSFGSKIEVVEPQSFRELIIERLKKQKSCKI